MRNVNKVQLPQSSRMRRPSLKQESDETHQEESEEKKDPGTESKALMQRWRRIACRVGKTKTWTKECIIKVLTDSEGDPLQSSANNKIPFNPNYFKAHVHLGCLGPRAKHLFTKDPDVRTEADIMDLFRVVDNMNLFTKFSPAIKRGLAKFVYFSRFPANRIVVQQGHPARSFYFIVKGSVNILAEEKDIIRRNVKKNIVTEMFAGETFGEFALLYDTERRATVICKEETEFLRLDKSDFDQVLRETYQKQWNERITQLRSMFPFKDWSEKDLCTINRAMKVVEHPDNSIVLKDEIEPPDSVYIIKSGECVVVRELDLIRCILPFGREKLILPRVKDNINNRRVRRLRQGESWFKCHLVIGNLRKGGYFGVGENMKDSYIISKGKKTEVMLIPRSILESYNKGRTLKIMREEMPNIQWTREDVFSLFLKTRKWNDYKKRVMTKAILEKSTRNHATYRDVPRCIRAENQYYYSLSMKYARSTDPTRFETTVK